MNERISRGPQQAVRDDAPAGVRDNRGRGRREVPIEDLSGNKETALLLKMPDSRVSPETAFFHGKRRRILSAAMANWTPRIRRAIELRELGELSTKETARMMGVSVGAVKARVFHGRKKLRRVLKRVQ